MPSSTIKVRSSGGGEFNCCLNVPRTRQQVPAVVLASADHGVDAEKGLKRVHMDLDFAPEK